MHAFWCTVKYKKDSSKVKEFVYKKNVFYVMRDITIYEKLFEQIPRLDEGKCGMNLAVWLLTQEV